MTSLEIELKTFIIKTLNLEDAGIEDIGSEEALFVDGLGLDSIDALELGVALKKKYNIRIEVNNEGMKDHFTSISSLARFIQTSGKEV